MGLKVIVRKNESVDSALRRLNITQRYEYKRWTKKRYGYFEKPSVLKRKQKKMAKLWLIPNGPCCYKGERSKKNRLHLYIGLKELFARSGPNNSAGH